MSHLAFADLCLGLYLLLIAAIDVHSMGEYFNFGYEWQYGKLNKKYTDFFYVSRKSLRFKYVASLLQT